jgi:hypothetical protein
MKRVRNDTFFDVLTENELRALGKRVVQVEYIASPLGGGCFLAEVMYEKV